MVGENELKTLTLGPFATGVCLAAIFAFSLTAGTNIIETASAHDDVRGRPHFKGPPASPTAVMRALKADTQPAQALPLVSDVACSGGFADVYPCDNVDLLAFLPLADIGGAGPLTAANDIWGWTDSVSGREFALMGRDDGTAFVEITDPVNPVYLGRLPTHTTNSSWRDIKTYDDHAFIVSEAGGHGMQVFNLRRLLTADPATAPYTFTDDAQYSAFGNAHNIVIDEDSGYAYAVGTSTCSGGLHMVDIGNPTSPAFAGCFSTDGYTHDAQCVTYSGPDLAYQGREICFASNTDTLTIVDVTNKGAPVQISRTSYPGDGYTHQGWLTPDQTYFLLDDELDEQDFKHNTRTRVFDVSDLTAPAMAGAFDNVTRAIDHNPYVLGDHVYQANYRAGLRVLEIVDAATADLWEVGYFDIYPSSDTANFNGAWSTYPYFDSGVVIVSGIEQGLFILRPNLTPPPPPGDLPAAPSNLAAQDNGDGTAEITFSDNSDDETGFELKREKQHKKHGWSNTAIINLAADSTGHTDSSGKGTFRYRVRAVNLSGASAWTAWIEVIVTSKGGGGGGGGGGKPTCHPKKGCA